MAGCESFEELRRAPLQVLYDTTEKMKTLRDDTTYCTMPVVDGVLIPKPVGELIREPLALDYLIGYSNADMYAPVMAWIGNRYARQTGARVYFFDLDAPGDDNRAFHSSDLRYIFETLDGSWRPYGARDHEAAAQMASYLANFARSGDPNGPGLPCWEKAKKGVLRIAPGGTKTGRTNYLKLTRNFIRRPDPKA